MVREGLSLSSRANHQSNTLPPSSLSISSLPLLSLFVASLVKLECLCVYVCCFGTGTFVVCVLFVGCVRDVISDDDFLFRSTTKQLRLRL